MSFLYPLFLAAGATLAIPVLIHLFNLRKYKTVLFPHTRFLKNIQLNSQKQSQVRYKLLLATRLLFLACLILAFAQPFFNKNNVLDSGNRLQVIYIDNSNSMSVKQGARTMLDIARETALHQVKAAKPGTRFLLLTNDRPTGYRPEPLDKVYERISNLDLTGASKNLGQILETIQSINHNDGFNGADLYYYSDFQEYTFAALPKPELMKDVTFYGMPMQAKELQDVYIDTAWLTSPVLEAGKNNNIIVKSHLFGSQPKDPVVLQMSVNGQVKSAATLSFDDKKERTDTLGFQVSDANWQKITLSLNDLAVKFDDTFRITARSATNLSVLELNEGQPNPYILASFRAYNGFRLNQGDAAAPPSGWENYNLIIVNGVTRINESLAKAMNDALLRGQSICIFPGRTDNLQALNHGLKQLGDINFSRIDTSVQSASNLQQGSALVKDLFDKVPDNVQLPVANWHYSIGAGLTANQQSVLSFRNGDPLFARYTPSKGQLYLCSTSADLQSGNFPGSYFFTPFLYEMALQSGGSNIYAITLGGNDAVYLPLINAVERGTYHLTGAGIDAIPPQRPNGAGLDVFVDNAADRPGFYNLSAQGSDTIQVALNQDKRESQLEFKDINALKKDWTGPNIKWPDITQAGKLKESAVDNFPLWKVCTLLAVLFLIFETAVLARVQKVTA